VTTDAGAGDAIPAESSPVTPVNQADILAQQQAQILSMVASVAAQVNWLCQIVNSLSQSMPPFMRGAVNVPASPPFPLPGQPPFGP